MKKKICCILTLIVLLLNSSTMLVISKAVEKVNYLANRSSEEVPVKAIVESDIEKYINFDTTTEGETSGDKGVLVQVKIKTGTEYVENQEYIPITKTETKITVPEINSQKPQRVEVIVKSTKATNGKSDAKYKYDVDTGIITITAENNTEDMYTGNFANARDEYEIILIYDDACYTSTEEEREINLSISCTEELNSTEITKVKTEKQQTYEVGENIGNIISIEHETDEIAKGYIEANAINSEAGYVTEYNETLNINISNKNIVQKIDIEETNYYMNSADELIESGNTLLYNTTQFDKNNIEEILGDTGRIKILNNAKEILETITSETLADENGNILVTFETPESKLNLQIENVQKEGIIKIVSRKNIIPTMTDTSVNKIKTTNIIKGINTIQNVENEKYTSIQDKIVEIKETASNVDLNPSIDKLVNNTENNITFIATLRTDDPKYSLFKDPTISIEMPEEVEDVVLGETSLMHNNQIFQIIYSEVKDSQSGNKKIEIKLEGSQNKYESSSFVEGTKIIIPATITLKNAIESKLTNFKLTYKNENTENTVYNQENKECEEIAVTVLNKVITVIPSIDIEKDGSTITYEVEGIQIEIIEKVGNAVISNNGGIFERQIIKHIVKITNNTQNTTPVSLTVNLPEELTYVELKTGGYIYNKKNNYYVFNRLYQYEENLNLKQIQINAGNIEPGKTYETFFELKAKDIDNNVETKEISIEYDDININNEIYQEFSIQNIIKQAKISVELKTIIGNGRRDWQYAITVTNLTNETLNNINVAFEASSFFEIQKDMYADGSSIGGIIEGNLWSYKIDSLAPYQEDEEGKIIESGDKYFILEGEVANFNENNGTSYELNGIAVAYNDELGQYRSNETRMNGNIEAVRLIMATDKPNQQLRWNEEITYTITVENIGKTWGGIATYTDVNLTDFIPRELEPISASYNKFTINTEYVLNEEYLQKDPPVEVKQKVETYTEEETTIDVTTLSAPEGTDLEEAPNLDLNLTIPEGKTVTITIKAKAKMLQENTDVTAIATAQGKYIKTKTATVTNTILKYNIDEEETKPDVPKDPDDPDNPDNPDIPVNPDNPTDPEKEISITGTAWIDTDEDGKRDIQEATYKDMQVMLYDYKNAQLVTKDGNTLVATTNENGMYTFNEIKQGTYIVIFMYDNNKYSLTEYQKQGVPNNRNSDAISRNIQINGENKIVGLTDNLVANSNLTNIDIGLIENKTFDMKIDKYINKITVQTKDDTKTYTYDKKQLAKVEIHSKKINGANVIIEYKIAVTNNGDISGKVGQIVDELPEDLKFYSELNKEWYENKGNLYTTSLAGETINPGESKEVTLILTKTMTESNIGKTDNIANIGISSNEKALEDKNKENDTSKAEVIISVSTGIIRWFGITFGILAVLVIGVILILKNKKALKLMSFILIVGICLFGANLKVQGLSIKGIDTNTYGVTAVGDDGRTYTCSNGGSNFCDDGWHPVTGVISSSRSEVSNTGWGPWESISIWNTTNTGNVQFSVCDSSNNWVGPFSFSKNHDTSWESLSLSYKDHNGNSGSGSFSISGSLWGNFYIKVPNYIVEITSVSVSAGFSYTQTTEVIYSVYVNYATGNCGVTPRCAKGTQSMQTSYEERENDEREQSASGSASVSGPWTSQGNLKITKVDEDNNAVKLPNVGFKITKGLGQYYMQLNQNGNYIGTINAGTGIYLSGYSAPGNQYANNPRVATIEGTTYSVTFTADYNSATIIQTNSSGEIYIENLRCGEYTAVEVSNTNYGYTQTSTSTTKGMTGLGTKYWTITNQKQTGNLHLKKIDDRNQNKVLPNVEFVLKSSLNNQYIIVSATGDGVSNNENGWAVRAVGRTIVNNITYTTDINSATRFVTNSNGELSIFNLIMSSNGSNQIKYHLEEVKNPNYGYLADTSSFNNYKVTFDGNAPSGWVTIPRLPSTETSNINSTQYLNTTIKNHQIYIRISGFVWKDIVNTKKNSPDNKYVDSTDALVQGIKVYLYKEGTLINTQKTDSNGYYQFGTEKTSYVNGDYWVNDTAWTENGNLLIDDLSKYYIEFEYDGLKFTTVANSWDYTNKDEQGSKAVEVPSGRSDRKDRTSVNYDFTEITNGYSRNPSGNTTYELKYNYSDHVSTYIDHWGYEYKTNSNNKKLLQVTYDYDNKNDYEIISSTKQSGYSLKEKWDKAYANTGNEVITNNNQGLYRREQPDVALCEDIETVRVITAGYENTYTYGGRKEYENQNENSSNYNESLDGFGIGVKFGNKYDTSYSKRGLNSYIRPLYEADLALYNQYYDQNRDLMQVYITYKITVKNQSTKMYSKINEIANYFDNRYTIVESWIGENKANKVNWSTTGKYNKSYSDSDYTAVYTTELKDMEIAPNGSINIHITFKVDTSAVRNLINSQATLNNVSEITSFSTGTKPNNSWVAYAGIDEDSDPGSVKIEWETNNTTTDSSGYISQNKVLDKTSYEDDTDSAPSLILELGKEDEPRGLSGTVFEDSTSKETRTGATRLGDGKYESNENTIFNAKVELLEVDNDGNIIQENGAPKVAKLYTLNVNNSGGIRNVTTTITDAVQYTDINGNYKFNGVIPDRYLIRYTYDDTCYIIEPNKKYAYEMGQTKEELTDSIKYQEGMKIYKEDINALGIKSYEEVKPLNVRDYKSTIITSSKIREALAQKSGTYEMSRMGNLNWILEYEKSGNNIIRYSDAVDDLIKRETSDDIYYGSYFNKELNMTADTAAFEVGVEFSTVNSQLQTWTDYRDEFEFENEVIVLKDGKVVRQPTFYCINPYQDFGIVERARQDIEIEKRISNLKLVLATGQVLLNGNPYTDNLSYIKALPGIVHAEIDTELIQGATLELEYTIKITNNSEADYEYRYAEKTELNKNTIGEYYYYGTNAEKAVLLTTKIKKVVDYMDSSLVYDEEKNNEENNIANWQVVTTEQLLKYDKDIERINGVEQQVEKQLISEEVASDAKNGYTIAMTDYFYKDIGIRENLSVKIYASKLLASSAEDITLKNQVEIIETQGIRTIIGSIPGNYNPKTQEPDEQDDDSMKFIITPPTGVLGTIEIRITIGIISMIILGIGIYIIKKKVIG